MKINNKGVKERNKQQHNGVTIKFQFSLLHSVYSVVSTIHGLCSQRLYKGLFEVFKKHLLDKCYSYMKEHRRGTERRNSNLCSQSMTHPSLWRCFYWFYFPHNRLITKWWCCQIITWETPNFLQASRKFSTFLRHFAMLSLGYKERRERQTFLVCICRTIW